MVQNRPFGSAAKDGANADAGFGSNRTGTQWDLTGISTTNGVETYVVFMPNTAGKVTLTGFTAYDSSTQNTPINVSVDVVDPNAALIAGATAAADAATDAANEAIDAANAATDAANIAAEAADAATVAAEEARDAADAATAAVEELATQVATLMAALSAQVKTLANTVAKIAKKVKA
jgi:flagellin-like hook-associated protein FlgL